MSGNGKQQRRKRANLFNRQAGLCFWCRKPMLLLNLADSPDKHRRKFPPEMCTIDHLEPRWHPKRGEFGGEFRLVAACLKCNTERDRRQQSQLPPELLHAAASGVKPRELARKHADEIAHIYPVIPLPKPKALRFTFEPLPKHGDAAGPLRTRLGELAKAKC